MLDDGYLLLEAIFYQGNLRKNKRINPREWEFIKRVQQIDAAMLLG